MLAVLYDTILDAAMSFMHKLLLISILLATAVSFEECFMLEQSQSDYQSTATETLPSLDNERIGLLTPADLPPPKIFDVSQRQVLTISNNDYDLATGEVVQINHVKDVNNLRTTPSPAEQSPNGTTNTTTASVSYVANLIPRETVEAILGILTRVPALDEDPDTVDAMPTFEIFVDSPELSVNTEGEPREINMGKILDVQPESFRQRRVLREELQAILQPLLEHRITPLVRHLYADVCNGNRGSHRQCTPCYSLIRHYRHGQRQSHA